MSTLEKLSELESRRAIIMNNNKNGFDARKKISMLLDENSFVEIGTFVKSRSTAFDLANVDTPADGVVTGYGTVNGRPVYVYSQDKTVLGGAIGEMHAKKIIRIYEEALKVGAPVIAFLDTAGLRLQESIDGLECYGRLYSKMVNASGKIPQIAIVNGNCSGGASFILGLSDYVFMNDVSAKVFLNSPNTMDNKSEAESIEIAKTHLEVTGLADITADDEYELVSKVGKLLSYLPQNSKEVGPFYETEDDLNRVDISLNTFDIEQGLMRDIAVSIADRNEIFELGNGYGKDSLIAFIRMDGGTVGIISNIDKRMSYKSVKKITKFIKICSTYNIPIVSLTNIEGFESTPETENLGMINECSKMIRAFAKADVAKVNVIVGKAYGSGYVAMNSQMLGCDMTYAWPSAIVAPMEASSAMKIMYGNEIENKTMLKEEFDNKLAEYESLASSAYVCAARGMIDDLIEPAATRKRIIAALQVLSQK